jgi:hypothetical protein
MQFRPKIVLHCKTGVPNEINALVEAFLSYGVKYVGIVGKNAALIESIIDECVVGDGSDKSRFILTASHEGETLEKALEFACSLTGEYEGEVQLIEI